jgi:hypothetical protein
MASTFRDAYTMLKFIATYQDKTGQVGGQPLASAIC